ncbi:MAG: hypothetical protein QGG40_20510, partial [Myxococcota bacterium]|nr:hypothetical protein [Myxococcota bacterium]
SSNAAVVALEKHLLGTMARRIRRTNQSLQKAWKADDAEWARAESDLASQAPSLTERLLSIFGGGS